MSLKAFHLVFISASTVLALGFASWCFMEYRTQGNALYAVAAGAAAVSSAALVYYGLRFARKLKGIGTL